MNDLIELFLTFAKVGALSGLKPCIIGIILATGIYMIWKNFNVCSGAVPDIPAIALTIVLGGLYFGLI